MAVKMLQNKNYLDLNMGALIINNTIDATSTSTGVLNVLGGTSITKNLFVGGTIDSTSTSSGAFNVMGGASIAKNLFVGGTINSSNVKDWNVTFGLSSGGIMGGTQVSCCFTRIGNSCIVTVASFSGTADKTDYMYSSSEIPTECTPKYGLTVPCLMSINSVITTCYITFQTNRSIVWHKSLTSFNFTSGDVIDTYTVSTPYAVA